MSKPHICTFAEEQKSILDDDSFAYLGKELKKELHVLLDQLATEQLSVYDFFLRIEQLLFLYDQLENHSHLAVAEYLLTLNSSLTETVYLRRNDNESCEADYFKLADYIRNVNKKRDEQIINNYNQLFSYLIKELDNEIKFLYSFLAEKEIILSSSIESDILNIEPPLAWFYIKKQLKFLVKNLIKSRIEHLKEDKNSFKINNEIKKFNIILAKIHNLYCIYTLSFAATNTEYLITPVSNLPKKIKEINETSDTKPYSARLHFNFSFSGAATDYSQIKWQERYLIDDFHLVNIEDENNLEEPDQFHIDNQSKISLHIHGSAGSDTVSINNKNKTRVPYQRIAKLIAESIEPSCLKLLQEHTSAPYLSIHLSSCSSGKGKKPGGFDSFAAKLHHELKESYYLNAEVIAYTTTCVTKANGTSATIKHGYVKLFAELKAKDEVAKKIYINEDKAEELFKHHQYLAMQDQLLVKKQPGTKVIFKWNEQGEQIREDGYKGGIWRANVYEVLVNCINSTTVTEKIEGLHRLLHHLDTIDESEIMNELKKILREAKINDIYLINQQNIFCSFFMNTNTHNSICNLINEYDKQALTPSSMEKSLEV